MVFGDKDGVVGLKPLNADQKSQQNKLDAQVLIWRYSKQMEMTKKVKQCVRVFKNNRR